MFTLNLIWWNYNEYILPGRSRPLKACRTSQSYNLRLEPKVISVKSSSIVISSALHISLVVLTALSLPFLSKKPIDLPPIVSVELIQITEETNIPFAPKAKKIIEKVKEKEKKLVSEQAPPKKVKKTKTKTVVSEKKNKKIEKQNPEAVP